MSSADPQVIHAWKEMTKGENKMAHGDGESPQWHKKCEECDRRK